MWPSDDAQDALMLETLYETRSDIAHAKFVYRGRLVYVIVAMFSLATDLISQRKRDIAEFCATRSETTTRSGG
jgi:hypothetical protein